MNNPSTIVIISENADFAEPLASLSAREFSAICKIVKNEAELQGATGDLAISDHHISGGFPFPIITVSLPLRVRELFAEIAEKLYKTRNVDTIKIRGNLQLSVRNKILSEINIDSVIPAKADTEGRRSQILALDPRLRGDDEKREVIELNLTDKETKVLQALSKAGEAGITREELLKNIWGMEAQLDTHTLETHIYRLRKKIRDSFDVEIIKAIDGGYRL